MSASRTAPRRPLVLIVDDHDDTREMYAQYLDAFGIRAVEARDGGQALTKASTTLPDLITIDLGLPGMQVCRRLKQQEPTRLIPIVAVTGSVDVDEFMQLGCAAVLSRPCSPNELLTEIRRFLPNRSEP